jgi:hypothetical protein
MIPLKHESQVVGHVDGFTITQDPFMVSGSFIICETPVARAGVKAFFARLLYSLPFLRTTKIKAAGWKNPIQELIASQSVAFSIGGRYIKTWKK